MLQFSSTTNSFLVSDDINFDLITINVNGNSTNPSKHLPYTFMLLQPYKTNEGIIMVTHVKNPIQFRIARHRDRHLKVTFT